MARGWESKSVESQMEDASEVPSEKHTPLTPEQQQKARQLQGLLLSRARVMQQMSAAGDPRYRELLQKTLADLDAQIAQLGP